MLTKFEMQITSQIYSLCCTSYTIPFIWSDEDQVLKTTIRRLHFNCLVWGLLLASSVIRIVQLPVVIVEGDANQAILHGLFTLKGVFHFIQKLNIWLHRNELSELVHQVLRMNYVWGKYSNIGKAFISHDLA